MPMLRSTRKMAGAIALAVMAGLVPMLATDGSAQGKRQRPAEEGPEQYPAHPSRDDAFYFCTACHSFKIVAAQGMSRERWDESLTWMVDRHNMPDVQGEDRNKILDYLASAFPERTERGGWKNPFAPK
jgi:hypothetical protein